MLGIGFLNFTKRSEYNFKETSEFINYFSFVSSVSYGKNNFFYLLNCMWYDILFSIFYVCDIVCYYFCRISAFRYMLKNLKLMTANRFTINK